MSAQARNPHWQRRCAAFAFDFLVVAAVALALSAPWWRADLRAADAAIDVLRSTMDATMAHALETGSNPAGFYATLLADPALQSAVTAFVHRVSAAIFAATLAYALFSAVWHVGGELSSAQGSPGKRLFGLRVVDRSGNPAAPAQLLLRQAASGLSWLTLNAGHLLAWWPPFRSLHDRIAGTEVVAPAGIGPLPAWARGALSAAFMAAILLPIVFAAWLAMRLTTP